MKQNPNEKQIGNSVPASRYTGEYYKSCCDGYDEFNRTQGKELPSRIMEPLQLLDMHPNSVILDVGCGRGELVHHLSLQGHTAIGFDYAAHGVKIAREALADVFDGKKENYTRLILSQANAKQLAVASNSVDYVFMLDVVEHLYPDELHEVFTEIYRALKPGGNLIIHTMPNTWYYAVGYPIYRLMQRLRGQNLPANPRDRWDFSDVHVNEQNYLRLKLALNAAHFQSRVWLTSIQNYDNEKNKFIRFGMKTLTKFYPFKLVFANDIFAIATKPNSKTDKEGFSK